LKTLASKTTDLTLENIPISSIEDNPYNSRVRYDEREIRKLASSLSKSGLLSPVRVRRIGSVAMTTAATTLTDSKDAYEQGLRRGSNNDNAPRFQLIFGHRRIRAARSLGWDMIRAEVGSYTDEEMLSYSISENLERADLSDYEKALSFQRMRTEFGKSLKEIGELVGYTESHVCNYVRMLKLFDASFVENNPSLKSELHEITERHARIILTIENSQDRLNAVHLAASEKMSVRDLQRTVSKLGGWFEKESRSRSAVEEEGARRKEESGEMIVARGSQDSGETAGLDVRQRDLDEINRTLLAEFELPSQGDFQSFANRHTFDNGFSIYGSFPPLDRLDDSSALDREKYWFYRVAPKLVTSLRDVRTQYYNDVAISTLCIDQSGRINGKSVKFSQRGTIVFIRANRSWKIVHEHWSDLGHGTRSLISHA